MIPYSRQNLNFLDKLRVLQALGRPLITQGPLVADFESKVCERVGALHGIAVNSATSALHIACLSLGLGKGDILWTSPISFVASANCGLYCGASVDFVDIHPATWNIDPLALRRKLEAAEADKRLPKVVVVVHLAGEPADLAEIYTLSRKFGFSVIEDASHALGSYYEGEPVGNCHYSDVTVFSFHAIKNLTTGEGGLAVTNNPDLAAKMRLLRTHGITRDTSELSNNFNLPQSWYYEQKSLGFNYRMTEFQAALGLSQLKRLGRVNKRRGKIVKLYRKHLSRLEGVEFQFMDPKNTSAAHLAIMRMPSEQRAKVQQRLEKAGFGSNLHYFPIHLQPYHVDANRNPLPEAEDYGRTAISLPCHQGLKLSQVRRVVRLVIQAMD